MEKIRSGMVVVSMIAQTASSGECPIPMGYVSKAIMLNYDGSEYEPVLWFEETESGKGNYPVKNFRLATTEEANFYVKEDPHIIALDEFKFLPGDIVATATSSTEIVVGISKIHPEPVYLVKHYDPTAVRGHNGNTQSLFIGSTEALDNNDGWFYYGKDIKKLSGTASTISGVITTYSGNLTGTNYNLDAPTLVPPPAMLPYTHVIEYLPLEGIEHQEPIILKSKSNKRKLITI